MRVACLIMQKDEEDLLEPWLKYHGNLFGAENIFLWDNGSSSLKVERILDEWSSLLGAVIKDETSEIAFRRKGVILGQKIKDLDQDAPYDFYIPLDCDEFIAVEDGAGAVSCKKEDILNEIAKYRSETKALDVSKSYYNLLGRRDSYWKTGFQKTFFRAGTFKQMDHGYHHGESKLEAGREQTSLVYIHMHHKPHATIVAHSRNKISPYYDVNDAVLMQSLYATNRLVRFMLDDEATYMEKFLALPGTKLPQFRKALEDIGTYLPFDVADLKV